MHWLHRDAEDLASEDLASEAERYTALLSEASIDAAFVGFGENGRIAFNDPPVADFQDRATVKLVTLDEACRRQQAGECRFSSLERVPKQAVTVSCTGLFGANTWICCVPEARKADAVRNALEGPIAEACEASLVRGHPQCWIYLYSASKLRQPIGEGRAGSEFT